MKKFTVVLLLVFAATLSAQEGARDADAVLNRCGKPLRGDNTVYTNAGSTRALLYERGTLLFTRVGDHGWKFVSGTHKKQEGLSAEQMAVTMPCLRLALADSAAPEPLQPITPVQRLATSAKQSYKELILYTLLGLVVLGILFFGLSRRKSAESDGD